jgi:hypothetical protein
MYFTNHLLQLNCRVPEDIDALRQGKTSLQFFPEEREENESTLTQFSRKWASLLYKAEIDAMKG